LQAEVATSRLRLPCSTGRSKRSFSLELPTCTWPKPLHVSQLKLTYPANFHPRCCTSRLAGAQGAVPTQWHSGTTDSATVLAPCVGSGRLFLLRLRARAHVKLSTSSNKAIVRSCAMRQLGGLSMSFATRRLARELSTSASCRCIRRNKSRYPLLTCMHFDQSL
jgi:hypothetical protein